MYGKIINNELVIYNATDGMHTNPIELALKGFFPVVLSDKPDMGYKCSYKREGNKIMQVWQYSVEQHIEDLKQQLRDTDYAVIKIAEGAATVEEYADVIAQRQEWRNMINNLQEQ